MEIKYLEEKIRQYNPNGDFDLVRKAFEAAKNSHNKQLRASGEDFIHHPIGVAEILADLQMDNITLAAALLHDVVEDTEFTLDRIEKEFGLEVRMLIDGVTKLKRISFESQEEQQAENFRKMILAMAKDIRIILIKLADRLHNMRTLCYLGKEKQLQKAMETIEIYAPLAHRLGINSMKWELEDLAFQFLYPRRYREIQEMVSQRRTARESYIDQAINMLSTEFIKAGIEAEISGRAKHFYSIYQKMVKKGKEFNEIYDLTAIRVLVDSLKDCYGTLGVIHSLWKPVPGRFKDYIAMPKFNMYQSLHTTVIGPMGRPLEIQIRTDPMHRTAEYGIAAHWIYKESLKSDRLIDERFNWLRQMLDWQRETKDPREFMETLKIDLYEDEVFVFTPRGEVKALPAGSTPIDFAYMIHTDVGHRCVGAKVNGKIVSLDSKLVSGDIIEILTSKTGAPSRDWLNIVRTSRAKNKIRAWYSKETREGAEHLGKEMLSKNLRKQGLPFQKLLNSEILKNAAKALRYKKLEDLFVAIGCGKLSPIQVTTKVINELKKSATVSDKEISEDELKERLLPGVISFTERSSDVGVTVKGVKNVLVRFARCCNPVSGDQIVGYVSMGKGIAIHQVNCSNVRALRKSPERFVEVFWSVPKVHPYHVAIQVEALDRTKLLRDITTVLSETDSGANILTANVSITENNIAVNRFLIEISDITQLDNLLRNIKKVETVIDAYRLSPKQ